MLVHLPVVEHIQEESQTLKLTFNQNYIFCNLTTEESDAKKNLQAKDWHIFEVW